MNDKELRVKTSAPFKLKDKAGRNFMPVHLVRNFGFVPEIIIIEKVRGESNRLIVRAVLTPQEIEKEDKEIEKQKKLKEAKREVGKK